MRKLKVLKICNLAHLCYHLNCSEKELRKLIQTKRRYYRSFEIEKKNSSKKRIIDFPYGRLKYIQSNLKNLLNRIELPKELHGGVKGCSPITNAKCHLNKPAVIKFDISSFYPSISFEMAYNLFSKQLKCSDQISEILAKLTTHKNHLPHGTPTSPIVANLIILPLVKRLKGLALKHGCNYTQFVDDGTFSGPCYIEKLFPVIEKIIREQDFEVKKEKNEFCLKSVTDQIVTGIKVNKELMLPKLKLTEIENLLNLPISVYNSKLLKKIEGKINNFKQINPLKSGKYVLKFNQLKNSVV